MSRADIREKFREAVTLLDKHNLMVSPIYLDFLRGERELECTAWGTPTFNPRGWKGPCYVITDNHYDSYREMIDKTPWEKYGPGNDPRCADCMMHVGFETTPVLGAKRQLGDTWTMLKWQFSGKMGGNPGKDAGYRPDQRPYRGRHDDDASAAEPGFGFSRRHAASAMKTLVTGATGFLGSHVARQLAERGESVRVLVRPSSDLRALEGFEAERVTGDLRDAASLDRALAGVSRVFHVAADYRLWARDPREIYESNVTGTRNLLEAARRAGVEKFVYTSTVATIAVPREGGLPNEATQSSLGEMIGHYKRSKFQAEQLAMRAAESGLPVVIVNPTTPVGPGDWKPTPTGKIIVDFLNGRMPGYVDTGLNFVPVEDCARGHLLAAERGRIGERYILGGSQPDAKANARHSRRHQRTAGAALEISPRFGLCCWMCGYGGFTAAGPRAADSARRRAHGAAQDVCGCIEGRAGTWFRARADRGRAGARSRLV